MERMLGYVCRALWRLIWGRQAGRTVATAGWLAACLYLAVPGPLVGSGHAWAQTAQSYAWRQDAVLPDQTLAARIAAPSGFTRIELPPNSFGAWLRGLPLKPSGAPVLLFNGSPKPNQTVHAAVIDIDTGTRDLQQCADAVMRLRAEWLYGSGQHRRIAFNNTQGKRLSLPTPYDAKPKRKQFERYMIKVFAYAGTYSLAREMKPRAIAGLMPGDMFIMGGFPGHAVLVADVVENAATRERRFLLLQSYMPAQDIHVLRNPADPSTPWYPASFGSQLVTPEWTFPADALKTWP
jgi:Domain of unknown function (4846)